MDNDSGYSEYPLWNIILQVECSPSGLRKELACRVQLWVSSDNHNQKKLSMPPNTGELRVQVTDQTESFSTDASVTDGIRLAIKLREKYTLCPVVPFESWPGIEYLRSKNYAVRCALKPDGPFKGEFFLKNGIYHVHDMSSGTAVSPFPPSPTLDEFYDDMDTLFLIRSSGPVVSFCFHRLKLLETKFNLYQMMFSDTEHDEMASTSHRDFYNVRKVDTHVHHSAAMNGKFLLRFIKRKLAGFPDDVVSFDEVVTDGKVEKKPLTLSELFGRYNISTYHLSLDKLNVMADHNILHRFDRFNLKYSPLGQPILRNIFLKTDNQMGGRYLAEITKNLLSDLEESKYQYTEWRLSIYGRNINEWDKLANWAVTHGLLASPNNKWMVQIPRLYSVYKRSNEIQNFGDMLRNIFQPLFEVTADPSSHPELAKFLERMSGFDTVDDESKSPKPNDKNFSVREMFPENWNLFDNPSYKYYSFYIHANIQVLNRFRVYMNPKAEPFSYR